jgi:hypothetical protein
MNDKMDKLRDDDMDEMLPEYDFSGGVRGKHYRAVQRGYKVIIHKTDGTTEERDYTLPEGAIMLDPDVRAYFSDGETVNAVLRGLINLIPHERTPTEVP